MEFYWVFLFIFIFVIARAKTQKQQEEEEERNPDSDAGLDGWEYKLLHSPRGRFKDPRGLADSLTMESAAGWMMLEKLDDKRLRLKRPVSAADHDFGLDFDPYRSNSPMTVSVPSGGAQRDDR